MHGWGGSVAALPGVSLNRKGQATEFLREQMAIYPPWSYKQELYPARAGHQPLSLVLRGETELSALAVTLGSGGH